MSRIVRCSKGKISRHKSMLQYSVVTKAGKYANISSLGTTGESSIFNCSSLEITDEQKNIFLYHRYIFCILTMKYMEH